MQYGHYATGSVDCCVFYAAGSRRSQKYGYFAHLSHSMKPGTLKINYYYDMLRV